MFSPLTVPLTPSDLRDAGYSHGLDATPVARMLELVADDIPTDDGSDAVLADWQRAALLEGHAEGVKDRDGFHKDMREGADAAAAIDWTGVPY